MAAEPKRAATANTDQQWWMEPPTSRDWLDLYRLCRERAYEELRLPVGDAEMWANAEADRLLYGGAE